MASSKKNLKGMTDAERLVLMEKMDRELDEFVDNAVARSKAMREKEGPKKKQTIDELADVSLFPLPRNRLHKNKYSFI